MLTCFLCGETLKEDRGVGQISKKESPITRSSSMSYAMQWKNDNLRMILKVALISLTFIILSYVLLNGTTIKTVVLVVNGEEKVLKTNHWVLRQLLDEQGIQVSTHDRISTSLDATLKGRDKIYIDSAYPIQLTVGSDTETLYTAAKTVGGFIHEQGIALGIFDKVLPSMNASLKQDDNIQIIRVDKKTEEVVETKFFDVEKKENPRLVKGKEKVLQKGENGTVKQLREKTFEDGQLVSTIVLSEEIQKESITEIVSIGTANPVAILTASAPSVDEVEKDGITFEVKRILNNVSLTAYSAHFASTGKTEEMPGYGETYTGTQVLEGRTIAVDPKVIPLGWWVYIDGIGFRRAEDIGSGVKGLTIDVYFDSERYANRFGRKYGYNVYVIGPVKPTVQEKN